MNDVAAVLGMSDDELERKKKETQTFLEKHGTEICLAVTAVASVGILLSMRKNTKLQAKAFKMMRHTINSQNKEAQFLRSVITEMKEKGLEFSYYPGLGVFEDHKLKIAESAANATNEIAKAREALEVLKALRGAA